MCDPFWPVISLELLKKNNNLSSQDLGGGGGRGGGELLQKLLGAGREEEESNLEGLVYISPLIYVLKPVWETRVTVPLLCF